MRDRPKETRQRKKRRRCFGSALPRYTHKTCDLYVRLAREPRNRGDYVEARLFVVRRTDAPLAMVLRYSGLLLPRQEFPGTAGCGGTVTGCAGAAAPR